MYLIEVYKDGEFIGYANGNWDYDDNEDTVPYIIPDMDFNRLPNWSLEKAEAECKELQDEFIMYDFKIKELD